MMTLKQMQKAVDDLKEYYGRRSRQQIDERINAVPKFSADVHEFSRAANTDYVNAFLHRYDDAGMRIPRGGSTDMPKTPMLPTPRGHAEIVKRPRNRDEAIATRDALICVMRRLFPKLKLYDVAHIADFGAGIVQAKFEERAARTPSLQLDPPELSKENAARLQVAWRNLDDNLLDTYVDRGGLE